MNFFGVGTTEIFVILIVLLILFGPEQLPEIAKKIGGATREMRDSLDTLNDQMNQALEASMEMDAARMLAPADVSKTSASLAESSPAPNSTPDNPEAGVTPTNPASFEGEAQSAGPGSPSETNPAPS